MSYNPDLIIIGFTGNDLDMPNYIRKKVQARFFLPFVIKSTFSFYFKNPGEDNPLVYSLDNAPWIDDRFANKEEDVPFDYQYMVGFKNFMTTMKNISDITIKKNVPLIITVTTYPASELLAVREMGFYLHDAESEFADYLEKNNIPEKEIKISNEDPHLNAFGHSIYADLLFNYVIKNEDLIEKIK